MSRENRSSLVQFQKEFQLQCQSLAVKDNTGYRLEFEDLNNVGEELSTRAGDLDVNRKKNRYPKVPPYDHCRVKLTLLDSQLHSDYINASYVPGIDSDRYFICTQGPLRSTQADFWRMVWEQNVHTIVMVTACKENGKVLCEHYWPQEQAPVRYGRIRVTNLHQDRGPHFVITCLHLYQVDSSIERRIIHYLYTGWPDQGIPADSASLCTFTERVRQHLDSMQHKHPVIVHCSAGVGRSGTFVALLRLLQLCVRGIKPDVRGVVYDLRRHRMMMVQNLEQYIFIHTCLLKWMAEEMIGYRSRVEPYSQRREQVTILPRHNLRAHLPLPAQRGREDRPSQREQPVHNMSRPGPVSTRRMHPLNLLQKLLPATSSSKV